MTTKYIQDEALNKGETISQYKTYKMRKNMNLFNNIIDGLANPQPVANPKINNIQILNANVTDNSKNFLHKMLTENNLNDLTASKEGYEFDNIIIKSIIANIFKSIFKKYSVSFGIVNEVESDIIYYTL